MTDPIAELERLARLKADGAVSEEEFAALKAKLLSQSAEQPQTDNAVPPSEATADSADADADPPDQADRTVDPKTGAIVVGGVAILAGLYVIGAWLMSHAVDLFTLTVMFFDIFGPLIAVILIVRWINGLVDKLAKSRRDEP